MLTFRDGKFANSKSSLYCFHCKYNFTLAHNSQSLTYNWRILLLQLRKPDLKKIHYHWTLGNEPTETDLLNVAECNWDFVVGCFGFIYDDIFQKGFVFAKIALFIDKCRQSKQGDNSVFSVSLSK